MESREETLPQVHALRDRWTDTDEVVPPGDALRAAHSEGHDAYTPALPAPALQEAEMAEEPEPACAVAAPPVAPRASAASPVTQKRVPPGGIAAVQRRDGARRLLRWAGVGIVAGLLCAGIARLALARGATPPPTGGWRHATGVGETEPGLTQVVPVEIETPVAGDVSDDAAAVAAERESTADEPSPPAGLDGAEVEARANVEVPAAAAASSPAPSAAGATAGVSEPARAVLPTKSSPRPTGSPGAPRRSRAVERTAEARPDRAGQANRAQRAMWRAAAQPSALDLVQAAWDAGEWEEAAAIGSGSRELEPRRLGVLAGRFGRALERARGLRGVAAAPALEEALGIAEEIGRHSEAARDVRRMLAALHREAATSAEARSDVQAALFHVEQALAVLPGDPASRAVRSLLATRSRAVYLEGYALQDLDPAAALRRFDLAVRLGGASDTWSRKAAARAARLRGEARSEPPQPERTDGV